MTEIAILIFFGALTGLAAGLLGIGGGVIAVPVLYYTLGHFGYPQDELMHVAVATSLAATIVTALGASLSHYRKRAIRFDALKPIFAGLLFGCAGGALLASHLDNALLRTLFGAAVLPLSLYFFFPRLPSPNFAPRPNNTLALWSLAVGCVSTLLGIGGGLFFVPILLGYKLPMPNAIATSSASTFASALFGTLAFIFFGIKQPQLPGTLGYVCLPAFLAISLSSLAMTPVGAMLAHQLPAAKIKRIFACALAATAIAMLIGD